MTKEKKTSAKFWAAAYQIQRAANGGPITTHVLADIIEAQDDQEAERLADKRLAAAFPGNEGWVASLYDLKEIPTLSSFPMGASCNRAKPWKGRWVFVFTVDGLKYGGRIVEIRSSSIVLDNGISKKEIACSDIEDIAPQ